MAGAIRGLGTGAYAASVSGASNAGFVSVGQIERKAILEERLKSENASALFPRSAIRAAVERSAKAWMISTMKNYAPMSEAAVVYGKQLANNKFDNSNTIGSKSESGWKPVVHFARLMSPCK